MTKFTPQIQDWTLAVEGGYVDHPSDPGGPTNMGITYRTLSAWRRRLVTKQDVRDLTREEALAIYKAQYWDAVRGDDLPDGLGYAVFDYGVNSGPARAIKDLQRSVGVAADGIIGVMTLDAISKRQVADLITGLGDKRRAFVRGLSTYSTFGRGWEARINSVERNALSLIGMSSTVPAASSDGKAAPETPSTIDTLVKNNGGWAAITGMVASIFGAIADQPILQLAAVAAIGFLLWKLVIARKKADPA